MKILRIIRQYFPAKLIGPTRQAFILTKMLSTRGIESIVYTTTSGIKGSCPLIEQQERITIKRFKPLFERGHFTFTPHMLFNLLQEDADIIHIHGYRNFQSEIGAIASLIKKTPLVLTTHGTLRAHERIFGHNYYLQIYDTLTIKFCLKRACVVVVTCDEEYYDALGMGIPANKIQIIPPGVELPPSGLRVPKNKKKILTVSRIAKQRNLELLLRVFKKVVDVMPDVKLVIVGDAIPSSYVREDLNYLNNIMKLIGLYRLKKNVEFKGWLQGEELWKEYLEAGLFIWTSIYDNFGQALVEAAMTGTPIVSTPVGIAPKLVGENKGGILVAHNDVNGMKKAVFRLLTDHIFYEKASNYLIRKSKEFTADAMVSKYEQIYYRAINNIR